MVVSFISLSLTFFLKQKFLRENIRIRPKLELLPALSDPALFMGHLNESVGKDAILMGWMGQDIKGF